MVATMQTETAREEVETRTDEPRSIDQIRRRRRTALLILVAVVALAAGALVLFNSGEVDDPTKGSTGWEDPSFDVPEGGPTEVDLKSGVRRATIVVEAADGTCWNAYIGSRSFQECGRHIFAVTTAPKSLGMNVKSTENERRFLGLAAWDADGVTMLQSSSTAAKFATVALNINPPR